MSSEVQTQNANQGTRVRGQYWPKYILGCLILAYIAFSLFYRLDQYPKPHYDEGAYLKVAKNYAVHGIYADYSEDRLSYLGPVVSVGATLILPIALLYKIFGVSILLGRIVVVAYVCLLLMMLFALTVKLLDRRSATLTVLFALISLFIVNNFLA